MAKFPFRINSSRGNEVCKQAGLARSVPVYPNIISQAVTNFTQVSRSMLDNKTDRVIIEVSS
jgi:hypothetical protein